MKLFRDSQTARRGPATARIVASRYGMGSASARGSKGKTVGLGQKAKRGRSRSYRKRRK